MKLRISSDMRVRVVRAIITTIQMTPTEIIGNAKIYQRGSVCPLRQMRRLTLNLHIS